MGQNYFASVTAGDLGKALEEKLFRSTLELIQSGIQVLKTITAGSGDFEVLFSNSAAQIFTGKGNKLSETVSGKNSLLPHLLTALKEETDEEDPARFYTHDHTNAVLQCSITRLADGFLLIYEPAAGTDIDITGVKQAEQRIHELNRALMVKNRELESMNSEIKTFSGIAETDYKETLQNLYTNLEFILTKDAKNISDAGKGNLRKMQAAIQKMKLLTDDIVSFSRLQTLDDVSADVDLNEILRIAKEDLADRIRESGAVIEADELPHFRGFPLLLSLLFYHLLDNAIKFGHEEKSPLIQIRYKRDAHPPENSIAAATGLLYHKVSVIDGGKGFDENNLDKLFTMFYRPDGKKYKGSGVGLAICRKIMDLHNGFITAESDGTGASFYCYFPV